MDTEPVEGLAWGCGLLGGWVSFSTNTGLVTRGWGVNMKLLVPKHP